MVVEKLLPRLVRWLAGSLRVVIEGPEPDPARPHVYAFLHGRQLPLLRYPRTRDVVVLSSRSRDGELQARLLRRFGLSVVRGSSSRGGAEGLWALVRAVKGGASAAMAVDGPRGPAGVVKPGALFVARAASALVVPITAAAFPALRLRRAWDRFIVPAPGARAAIVRGAAFDVARARGDEGLEESRLLLEGGLERLSREADLLVRGGAALESESA